MKDLIVSIRMYIFWTLLLGLAYPVLFTLFAQGVFPNQANGEMLSRGGQVIGSNLISQKFEGEKYFWERPSAVDYNPLSSGGSNAGPTSAALQKAASDAIAKLKTAHPSSGEPPQDLVFASASGLDPQISPEAARFQADRVARSRALPIEKVLELVAQSTEGRQWGVFGEPRVNVLALNLSLDAAQGINVAPILEKPAPK